MRSELRSILRPAAWCAALLLTCGCSRTMLDSSVADTHGGSDVTSELDFWDELALQDAVSNRDALHALLLTFELLPTEDANDEEAVEAAAAEGDPAQKDAPAQVESAAEFDAELVIARRRGWIGEDDVLLANETAQVGWMARAVCLEADIEGGVNMRLFGPIPRYALRELTYAGLMGTKSENQALSGLELMATIGRIGDRRTGLVSMPRQDF